MFLWLNIKMERADPCSIFDQGFLLCCSPAFIYTSVCGPLREKEVEWNQIPPDSVQSYINGCKVNSNTYKNSHLQKLSLLSLTSSCIRTLPHNVLSDLKKKCLKELPNLFLNHSRLQGVTPVCACELINHSTKPLNNTSRAEMLKSCGSTSVGVAVGVSLLVLLVVCGIGCVWHWKRGDTTRFTFPKFLQRRNSRRKDYTKNPCLSSYFICSNLKTSVETKGHKSTPKGTKMHGNYENVETGPPKVDGSTDKALYENTRPSNLEECTYRNQGSSLCYNVQNPNSSSAFQEEDIYILPDSY